MNKQSVLPFAALVLTLACMPDANSPVLKGPPVVQIPEPDKYPPIARLARVQGEVIVRGTVDADGKIIDCVAEEGPPILRPSSQAWVRAWRFSPSPEPQPRMVQVRVRYLIFEPDMAHPPRLFPWCVSTTPGLPESDPVITTTTVQTSTN
jgi:TonB family protein